MKFDLTKLDLQNAKLQEIIGNLEEKIEESDKFSVAINIFQSQEEER